MKAPHELGNRYSTRQPGAAWQDLDGVVKGCSDGGEDGVVLPGAVRLLLRLCALGFPSAEPSGLHGWWQREHRCLAAMAGLRGRSLPRR